MIVPIETNKRKYFRQALELLRPIPPINTLANRELDVLAEFLYYNDKYKDIASELRAKVIFDYDTKLAMREYLEMGEAPFNNILTSLRKKGVLPKRGVVNSYGLSPENPDIVFKFKINVEED
jgi:hypothetical protein